MHEGRLQASYNAGAAIERFSHHRMSAFVRQDVHSGCRPDLDYMGFQTLGSAL
jgi:hypothetical protein